jgi:shikimate kinase
MKDPAGLGPSASPPAASGLPSGPIVLVGLSGAGKTAVGRLLASRLAWSFLDLDSEVERIAGCSIPDLFAREGERVFRDLEGQVTRSAHALSGTVVSTGGGWMARRELRDTWPDATRVWLRVEPDLALSRLAQERSSRPLLAGPDPESKLRKLLAERIPVYRLAEIEVRTDGLSPEAVVDAILDSLVEGG